MEAEESHNFPAIERALRILKSRNSGDVPLPLQSSQDGLQLRGVIANSTGTHNCQDDRAEGCNAMKIVQKVRTNCDLASLASTLFLKRTVRNKVHDDAITSPILCQRGIALCKALEWCRNWHILLKSFHAIKDYCGKREQLRFCFHEKISHLKNPDTTTSKFNKKVSDACVKRLGKYKLSLLYESWNLKRKYFIGWLTFFATKHSKKDASL
jgi:hypothetical protein